MKINNLNQNKELNNLIEKIIPFYNDYKRNQKDLDGASALEIIWEVGDLLKIYLKGKKIAPRTLYYQIYGKSENNENITQKSYITRDFLDRSYRVRRIFKKKSSIRKQFPTLQRYRLFYKSMPFLDEGRFRMNETDRKELIELLNSSATYKQIMSQINKLKSERINLRIPHDSKLKELEVEKKVFIETYNYIYEFIRKKNYEKVLETFDKKNYEFFVELSRNVGALSSDELKITTFDIPEGVDKKIKELAEIVNKLASKIDAKERRRFRRLIPPEKMMKLSEMIYALTNANTYKNFRI